MPKSESRFVNLFDAHHGYEREGGHLKPLHDQKAIEAAFRFTADFKPDTLTFGGDMMDCGVVSHWKENKPRQTEGMRLMKDAERCRVELIEPAARLVAKGGRLNYMIGNHECHDEATEFLTKDGWKSIEDFEPTDELLTKNFATGFLQWQQPTDVITRHYEGPLYVANNRRVSFAVTPGHRFYSWDRQPTQHGWQVFTAEEASTKERITVPVCGNFEDQSEYPISDALLFVAGIFLTDGCYASKYHYPNIYQAVDKIEPIIKALCYEYIDYSYTVRPERITNFGLGKPAGVIHILESSADRIRELVPSRDELPAWVNKLSSRQFEVFLDALIYGDGTILQGASTAKALYLKPKPLLNNQLQAACIQHGYSATISEYRPGQERLNLTKRELFHCMGGTISIEAYNGLVWCFKVPNDSFFTRRNGKVVCSGNCWVEQYVDAHPELEGLVDLDSLLRLATNQWQVIQQGEAVRLGKLFVVHGDMIKGSAFVAKRAVELYQRNIHFGHHHTLQLHTNVAPLDDKPKQGVAIPCLCRRNPSYAKNAPNRWLQGFEYGWVEADGSFHYHVVQIINGEFHAEGKLYKL